jgi:CRP-like cAMP-binding protein
VVLLSPLPSFSPRNRLLQALPADSLARLRPHLSQVELPLRQTLHLPEAPITQVYFMETGWVSMVAPLEDGDGAEVGIIGYEGFVGLPILLGSDSDDVEAMVQCQGTAFSLSTEAFRAALGSDPILQAWLLRYALVHQSQVARTAACNGRHQTEQRLARWLLMAHDRVEGDSFPMTHEFLAMMLGLRRAGVTMAAGLLQKAGLISYERGRMAVIDRPGLENVSCECYGIVRRTTDRLFAQPGQPYRPYAR